MRPTTDAFTAEPSGVSAIPLAGTRRTPTSLPQASDGDSIPNVPSPGNARWVVKIVVGLILAVAAASGRYDVMVVIGMAAVVAGTQRRALAIAAVLLFTVSFPPLSWPTWWFCLTPLFWIWREQALKLTVVQIVAEAAAIGFAMGWLSTGFVRAALPVWGGVIHATACLLFSLQIVALAMAIQWTRDWPKSLSVPICALTAVAGEVFEAWCGVSWSVTNLALTVGATPVAQWSRWITPFGVSGLLYLVNFTLACEIAPNFRRRWLGPALGVGVAVLAWCGGCLIARTVSIEPLPFSVLLVQPHVKGSNDEPRRPWLHLDRITRASVLQDEPVDLVVWPESSLSESWSRGHSEVTDIATRLTVQDFSHILTPVYQTNCLMGVTILEEGTTHRYGLEVVDVRRYNCGCLVFKTGEIARHEKLSLVPLKEGLPWLLDHRWIRDRVLPGLRLHRPLVPGREFRQLSFRDQRGQTRSIAVSVCYESLLPWLPQYHDGTSADAIVHLVYDGCTAGHPGMMQRHIRACQYRAIETRKWNLVCSTWTGTAIIDPSGQIVSQLAATAGALRSDVVGRNRGN